MEERIFNAALAGLLHDIGKVEQRARVDPWNPAPGITQEGQPVHATWTTYFVQNYVPKPYHAAALAGAYHHVPGKSPAEDKGLSELIALADRLSAGERADQPDKESQLPKQLVTIFDRITMNDQTQTEGWHYLPLKPLALDDKVIFPADALSDEEQGNAYDRLCEYVRTAAGQSSSDPQSYLENLLGAMQRSTWCVPSAYYHSIPDVSLYDHSRMTAALAVCLSEFNRMVIREMLAAIRRDFEGKPEPGDNEILERPVALLIGGDISGLQNFIYTISSKGAARTLRGRSFYLQLLTEAILRYTLRELGLPYLNVIYSGGGHFFLLAPVSASEKLPAIRRQITQKLLDHHHTSLYLAVGLTPVPANGLRVGQFPIYWGKMHAELAHAKLHRYTELGDELYERIFKPPELGGNPDDTCSVCGEDQRAVMSWDEEREEQARICTLCRSFAEDLGKQLPSSSFIALGLGEPTSLEPGQATDVLRAFGLSIQFLENKNQPVTLPNAERITLWAVDDPEGNRWPETGGIPAAYLIRYTVNRIPPDTFDELKEKVTGGFKRLGVLRMDVDNLGIIFKHGFGKLATLARLSTLSFQISLFFEGWVKYLCETGIYKGLIYAVYAGGDDVFVIGPWDRMPDLAQKIAGDFATFTGKHPFIHLSAGLAFIGGKYPVYQAAEDAAEALGKAKGLPGKNAFSFLSLAWPWTTFNSVSAKQIRIRRLVAGRKIDTEGLEGPQAIIQILRQLAEDEADQAKRLKGRPVWGPWMWHGAYLLTRMAGRLQSRKPDLAKAILSIRDELNLNNYQEINQWGTAARWTQLEIRKR